MSNARVHQHLCGNGLNWYREKTHSKVVQWLVQKW